MGIPRSLPPMAEANQKRRIASTQAEPKKQKSEASPKRLPSSAVLGLSELQMISELRIGNVYSGNFVDMHLIKFLSWLSENGLVDKDSSCYCIINESGREMARHIDEFEETNNCLPCRIRYDMSTKEIELSALDAVEVGIIEQLSSSSFLVKSVTEMCGDSQAAKAALAGLERDKFVKTLDHLCFISSEGLFALYACTPGRGKKPGSLPFKEC